MNRERPPFMTEYATADETIDVLEEDLPRDEGPAAVQAASAYHPRSIASTTATSGHDHRSA
jgi:hypothetical protein